MMCFTSLSAAILLGDLTPGFMTSHYHTGVGSSGTAASTWVAGAFTFFGCDRAISVSSRKGSSERLLLDDCLQEANSG